MEECRVNKNIELKIWRQKFWLLFTLLTFSPVSIAAASCYNYIGPCGFS